MEIPTELLLSKEAPKRKANELTHDSTHDQRQNDFEQRQGKVNIKLEHGINKALKEAGYPYINKVCEHCGLDKQALLPQLEEGVCQQYLMSGRCKFGKRCKFTHRQATDEEADMINQKLDRFIKKPLECKGERHSNK